jgi:hypothetical protein
VAAAIALQYGHQVTDPVQSPTRGSAARSLTIEELLDEALEATVRTGLADPGQALVAELERRGDDAGWEAAGLCLGLLAARPSWGPDGQRRPEQEVVDSLRRTARTADPATSITMEVLATTRQRGAEKARPIWDRAPAVVRRVALLHLLIMLASLIEFDGMRLSAHQVVRLVRVAIPPSTDWPQLLS